MLLQALAFPHARLHRILATIQLDATAKMIMNAKLETAIPPPMCASPTALELLPSITIASAQTPISAILTSVTHLPIYACPLATLLSP